MSETKAEVEEQRDALAAELDSARAELERTQRENEQLRSSLVATKPSGEHQAASGQPYLTEAERAELELRGWTVSPFTGRIITRDEALQVMAGTDQHRVEIGEPSAATVAAQPKPREVTPMYGVTHVFPSVAPGVLANEARVDDAGNARLPGDVVG